MDDRLYWDLLRDLLGNSGERDIAEDKHKVFIISGSPGSGKTKYVTDHKKHGDLVFDFDYICAALGGNSELYEDHKPFIDTALSVRETIYNAIEQRKGDWKNAYVITASRDMQEVRQLAKRLGGEIVDMLNKRHRPQFCVTTKLGTVSENGYQCADRYSLQC